RFAAIFLINLEKTRFQRIPYLVPLGSWTDSKWLRGSANYTGVPGGKVGNTCFGGGDSVNEVMALEPAEVKSGSQVDVEADIVKNLDIPRYHLSIVKYSDCELTSVEDYPMSKSGFVVPKTPGLYFFFIEVDWGKGDNSVGYNFKLKVTD
ncbi:hypothetical protein, partial [Heliophilum fasciatum]